MTSPYADADDARSWDLERRDSFSTNLSISAPHTPKVAPPPGTPDWRSDFLSGRVTFPPNTWCAGATERATAARRGVRARAWHMANDRSPACRWEDFRLYICNNHVLLATFAAHPYHPHSVYIQHALPRAQPAIRATRDAHG